MDDNNNIYAVTKMEVAEEFKKRLQGRKALPFKEALDFREYAKSRTDLNASNPTPEQVIWKTLYVSLTEELHATAPGPMSEIEKLDNRIEFLKQAQYLISQKLAAQPVDYDLYAFWALSFIGGVAGWLLWEDWAAIVTFTAGASVFGLLLGMFLFDSATLQSRVAIFLHHRLGLHRLAHWLYKRSLAVR